MAMDAGLERTLREERDRLTALAEASSDFATAGPRFQEVAERVVRRVAELIGDSCLMMLVSRDGHWLKPTAVFHVDPEARHAMDTITAPRPIDLPSLAAEVVRDNQALLIPELDKDAVRSRMWPDVLALVERFGTHSLLFVPMRARGRVIGALGLTRESARPGYGTEDQAFLQTLADTAAAALESVRLAQEARRQLHERRRAEELSRRIIESTQDCIQVLDFEGRLLMLNTQSQQQMGLEDTGAWLTLPWAKVWAEADQEAASRALDASGARD